MEVAVKNVVELIELNKKRLELELKKSYLELNKKENDSLTEISGELEYARKYANSISSDIDRAGIKFRLIGQEKISDINSKLSTFSHEDQVNALTSREGEVYELLRERGSLLKNNFENRENLAKLLILVSKVTDPQMRCSLTDAIEKGRLSEAVVVKGCDSGLMEKIVLMFNRVGIPASHSESEDGKIITGSSSDMKEMPFVISNRKVWVAAEAADKLNQNLDKLGQIHPKLQWKNAQRQIKDLSDDEEDEFKSLQRKYLDLLKEQDEILKEFNEEENLTIKVS